MIRRFLVTVESKDIPCANDSEETISEYEVCATLVDDDINECAVYSGFNRIGCNSSNNEMGKAFEQSVLMELFDKE